MSWDYSVYPNHNTLLVLKYDSNGTFTWGKNYATPYPAQDESWGFRALTTDSAGNIYIGGRHSDQCQTIYFNTCDFDALVLKLDPGGNFQWARRWGQGGTFDAAFSVALDSQSHLLVSGIEDVFGTPHLFTLSYDLSGNLLSEVAWSQAILSTITGIALDKADNAYVVGAAANKTGVWGATSGIIGSLGDQLVSNPYSMGAPTGVMYPLTNQPVTQTTNSVKDNGGGGADLFITRYLKYMSGGAFLDFPLPNRTASNGKIISVFDHSQTIQYCPDNVVYAYTGEQGTVLPNYPASGKCSGNPVQLYEFAQANGQSFDVKGQYVGDVSNFYLAYDGHPGYDFKTKDKDQDPVNGAIPVLAAADGIVRCVSTTTSSCPQGPGEIKIDHLNGYYTIYLHLDLNQMKVSPNQQVSAGQQIGVSGKTGAPGGPHLHFEVRQGKVPVDPYGWAPTTGSATDPYTRAVNVNLWR